MIVDEDLNSSEVTLTWASLLILFMLAFFFVGVPPGLGNNVTSTFYHWTYWRLGDALGHSTFSNSVRAHGRRRRAVVE